MVAYELDLNVIPGNVRPRLNVSQYDHGQTISFVLWNLNTPYSLPSGAAVSIAGTKPDGTGFIYACELQNNQPVATITEQMSAVAGEVTCELAIVVDSDRQGTINFIIDVEPAALRSDVPISETDIPVIEQIPEMVAEATEQAQLAEAWATGGEGGEASATNNAKYWAEQSQEYAVGALHWKGNTTFANIPTTDITTGDVYNVTDAFTTDSRFNEGAGIECEAGTNIIYGNNGKWDVQAPPSVHSFNGRKGAVVPASGDYTDELVTSSAITGKATVKAALQGLNTDKQPKTLSQAIAGQTTVEGCLTKLNTDLTAITWRTSSAGFIYCVLPNGMKYAYKLQSITSGTERTSTLHPNSYWGTAELNISDIGFTKPVLAHADFKGSYPQHLSVDAGVNYNQTGCVVCGFLDQPNSTWECQVELIGF